MSTENKGKLLDEVRRKMRLLHYSIHTERSYLLNDPRSGVRRRHHGLDDGLPHDSATHDSANNFIGPMEDAAES